MVSRFKTLALYYGPLVSAGGAFSCLLFAIMSELLTPDELAARYKVSGRTIRRWHADGLIEAEVDAGQIIRFDPLVVAAALKRNAKKKTNRRS